jgi:hypothetical protein
MCDFSLHHVESRPAKVGDTLRQLTSTQVLGGLPRRRIPQPRCAFFLEQNLLFPKR